MLFLREKICFFWFTLYSEKVESYLSDETVVPTEDLSFSKKIYPQKLRSNSCIMSYLAHMHAIFYYWCPNPIFLILLNFNIFGYVYGIFQIYFLLMADLFQSCVGNKVIERITDTVRSETESAVFGPPFQVNFVKRPFYGNKLYRCSILFCFFRGSQGWCIPN